MKAYELIQLIRSSGGKITCDNKQLIVEAAPSVLTEEIEGYLRSGKSLLVIILKIEKSLLLFRQKHHAKYTTASSSQRLLSRTGYFIVC